MRLALPPGFTLKKEGLSVANPLPPIALDGVGTLEHGGPPGLQSGIPRARASATPDGLPALYSSETPFPPLLAELATVQRKAGIDIAVIRLFPAQYLPSKRTALFHPELLLRARLTPAPPENPRFPSIRPLDPSETRRALAGFIDNPADLEATLRSLASPTSPSAPAGGRIDYLILTPSNLVASFQPLLEQKRREGLTAATVALEEIASTTPGRDLAEKMRNHLRQSYTNSGLRYLLLGGDTTSVPCRYAFIPRGASPRDSTLPCDLYFACLDGSWNRTGDSRWGEVMDGEGDADVDLLAEIAVGRAPVDTPEEAAAFVEKQLRYRAAPPVGWTNVLLMGAFLGDFPTGPAQGADMFDPVVAALPGYQFEWLDDRPGKEPKWSGADSLAALNRSPHLVLYNGHGDPSTMMRLEGADLAPLSNSSPFLIYSIGCNSGRFDNDKFSPDCIGEEFVKLPRAGAVAALLNSHLGWFDPKHPLLYAGEFQRNLLQQLAGQADVPLGNALQRGRELLVGQVETSGLMTYRWCYYEITLLGDPGLRVWVPGRVSH